jgi:hypothetical protein
MPTFQVLMFAGNLIFGDLGPADLVTGSWKRANETNHFMQIVDC